jgi:hypothetical protein
MFTLKLHRIPLHLLWIMALLEGITVPMVAGLPRWIPLETKSVWQGAVVGFLGLVVLLIILNRILPRLRVPLGEDTLTGISVLPAALWNMLLLALIFGIQKLAGLLHIGNWVLHYALSGFLSVGGAVLITLLLYQALSPHLDWLNIHIKSTGKSYTLRRTPVALMALLGGIYEGCALPIILLWQKASVHVPLTAAVTGILGGLAGCMIVLLLYNGILRKGLFIGLAED